MKIRNGFVSNSSSASFVIKMKTSLTDEDIEKYIRQSDEWLDKYWEGGKIEQWDWKKSDIKNKKITTKIVDKDPTRDVYYKRIDENTISISPSTTMFNDWMDVPGWKFIRAVNEEKIEGIKIQEIIKTEEESFDINEKTSFDPRAWGYEWMDNEKDRAEYNLRQNEDDLQYQNYLIQTGYIPTEEEIVEFTKNQLNQ